MRTSKLPFLVLLLSLYPAQALCAQSIRLFSIERSTNANYVCYDLNLTDAGSVDSENPISAYWVMAAQDGHQEELTGLEKSFAYGFSVNTDPNGALIFTTKALKSQKISISLPKGQPSEALAETEVNGHHLALRKIFVQTTGGLFAHVEYVKFTGQDLASGTEIETLLHP